MQQHPQRSPMDGDDSAAEQLTEQEFRQALDQALFDADEKGWLSTESVSSFEETGLLTSNEGLVVKLANGQEFQVTIVESTRR